MSTAITQLVAAEHVADLRRAAEREGPVTTGSQPRQTPRIELRLRNPDEAQVERRLAELDEAPELEGQVLLALIDGNAVAGLSLSDRRVVANPFVPTREAVALLRLRADQLSQDRPRRGLAQMLRLRSA
jgi:hypothetical protein